MNNLLFRTINNKLVKIFILFCMLAYIPGTPSIALAQDAAGKTVRISAITVPGFHVSGRSLLDANENNFIMRGINVPHNWYPEQTSQFQNTKAKGANTVRVVLSSGQNWPKNNASDVANVINLCKTNKLVCVLEVHDTTGYGEATGAITLAQAVNYWKEIQSVLTGQEAYVIINIGNEPYGNNNTTAWINATKNAIAAMRTAGFQHLLMVDAPDWGQDWEFIMRDNAASILNSDPLNNTVFSIHMYGVFDTASKVQAYVAAFVNAGLPLVIGEFGHQHTDGNPDEDSIMAVAQSNGIGYLGWMWSGGGYLDMVTNFNPQQETAWGNRIIHGANGIASTSIEASVYSGINASVQVTMAGTNQANYSIAPKDSVRASYNGINNGPVKVTSTLPIVASERVAYSPDGGTTWTSHAELMGLPANLVHTSYTFPFYNNVDLNSQLRFGNVGTASTTVTVIIGGQNKGNFTLAPNASRRVSYAGLNAGPVVIRSNGQPIIASLRVAYNDGSAWTSFSEMMGLPSNKLTSSYTFPWYNNLSLNSQLRFGNVGTVPTNVTVTIGGQVKGTYPLNPNESNRVSYLDLDRGPVKITSSGNVPIIASMRVAYHNGTAWTDFSEMMGLPTNALSTRYSFPIYDNVAYNSQ
ncbi:MAG TPA: glycoside hydrolase family 5 protein, partial [Anaerolineales bacterium]|nr:glycoside hydrolase family 5 protein [Anaerolineales bacterium]